VDQDLVPLYNGKLFYARDAFDGLHAMDELTQKKFSTEQDA
jgi:cobalamin-dependent methionine synthase I